jgi:hypothetical protein
MPPYEGGRFTEFIYILGKPRRSVNRKPLLRAGARADQAARVTDF